MNFATIGTSWITRKYIEAAVANNRWHYVAAYSRNIDTAENFVRDFCGVTCFDDLDKLADFNIDAIYIASPNSIHFEQAKFFLQRKIHVICEKPICSDYKMLDELIKTADENHVYLIEAFRHIELPTFDIIKAQIKTISPVRQLNLHYNKYSSRYNDLKNGKTPNIFSLKYAGGALMDLGVYPISFCVALFGAPKNSIYSAVKLPGGVDGCGSMILEYDSFVASLSFSKITTGVISNEILGEQGSIKIDHLTEHNQITLTTNGTEIDLSTELLLNPMIYEAEVFYDIIADNNSEKYHELREISKNVMQILDRSRMQNEIVWG